MQYRKVLSLLAALALMGIILCPVLALTNQAFAASTYLELNSPRVLAEDNVGLGSVEVYVPNTAAFTSDYDVLTVSLPQEVKIKHDYTTGFTAPKEINLKDGYDIDILVPATVNGQPNVFSEGCFSARITSPNSVDIIIERSQFSIPYDEGKEGKFVIVFRLFDVGSCYGDICAVFIPPQTPSVFSAGTVCIGKVVERSTVAMVKSVKEVNRGASDQLIDTIVVAEEMPQSIVPQDKIFLALPPGYTWSTANGAVSGSWAFSDVTDFIITGGGTRELCITVNSLTPDHYQSPLGSTRGRINIGIEGLDLTARGNGQGQGLFRINVPNTAVNGDVVVCHLSGTGYITPRDFIIARVVATEPLEPEVILVSSLTLSTGELTMKAGDAPVQLTANVLPENATNKTLEWASSAPEIATVTSGLVTAIKEGTATITARTTDGSNLEAACQVKVVSPQPPASLITPVKSVLVYPLTAVLPVNKSVVLTAAVWPLNATDRNLVWTSSNTGVAVISPGKSSAQVRVTGVAPGTATITAITSDGGKKASCRIWVTKSSLLDALKSMLGIK